MKTKTKPKAGLKLAMPFDDAMRLVSKIKPEKSRKIQRHGKPAKI